MACAIDAQQAGFRTVLVDKGCLCNSLFHYPSYMTFFTTSELLEIGNIPFPSPNSKPTRNEADYEAALAESSGCAARSGTPGGSARCVGDVARRV